MKLRKFLTSALTAAVLCSLLVLPQASAAGSPGFVDISDPDVGEAAALLQIMEVVDGNGSGYFFPELNLTRAQFCKMAVNIRGEGSKAEAQQNRTIFLDVPATHWGRGYINYASSIAVTEGGERLVMGVGDGTFHPDDNIAFDQAVTMTMRLLGYTAADVHTGATWYDGYLSTAKTIELLDGLEDVPHDAPLTRAQAAVLFRNLLFTKPKGSDSTYLSSLGGSEVEGGIVLDVEAKADDGSPAFQTTKGTYKTGRSFDASLEGREGKVVLNKDSELIAFVPKTGVSERVVNVTSTEATYLLASGGEKLTVEPETVVYQDNKATTWKDCYLSVATPTPVTFHYGADGKLSHLFFSASDPDGADVMVARRLSAGTNPFASMAGGKSYTMFKNGALATAADIRPYDVAVYDAGTGVIQISDLRLTGIYEDASPSPAAPTSIKVMGRSFPVLSAARQDLSSFKVGDELTLLLTADAQVAGAVSPDVVKGEAVGIASVTGGVGVAATATVKLLQGGVEVSGIISSAPLPRSDPNDPGPTGSYNNTLVKQYNNQLVTVTSSKIGYLSLELPAKTNLKGDFDVTAHTLDGRELVQDVLIYDQAPDGGVVAVNYDSLTLPKITKDKISFVSYDYAGRVKYILLNDVTGDTYQYGYFTYYSRLGSNEPGGPMPPQLCVRQGDADGKETYSPRGIIYQGSSVRQNAPGGVAYTGGGTIAATVTLSSAQHIARSAFDLDDMSVNIGGVSYVISPSVQCYNKTSKTWFAPGKAGVEAARAYSDDLTLYFDRPAAQGGKIRLIEVP